MKYINKYETEAEVQAAINNGELLKPYVAYITSSDTIDWNSKDKIDYSKMYLTIEALENGNISVRYDTFQYSLNGGNWTQFIKNVNVALVKGDKIRIKNNDEGSYYPFTTNFRFNIYGNIMSAVKGDNFLTNKQVSNYYFLEYLKGHKVVDASNLILPSNTYMRLYEDMFERCTNLTTAPELPATTLAQGCYRGMFNGCTSLTTAPTLLATTLAASCYGGMFNGCSSLNYIKCLATNISASQCTIGWVSGVSSTGVFVKDASMSNWTTGTSGIPNGWTVNEE